MKVSTLKIFAASFALDSLFGITTSAISLSNLIIKYSHQHWKNFFHDFYIQYGKFFHDGVDNILDAIGKFANVHLHISDTVKDISLFALLYISLLIRSAVVSRKIFVGDLLEWQKQNDPAFKFIEERNRERERMTDPIYRRVKQSNTIRNVVIWVIGLGLMGSAVIIAYPFFRANPKSLTWPILFFTGAIILVQLFQILGIKSKGQTLPTQDENKDDWQTEPWALKQIHLRIMLFQFLGLAAIVSTFVLWNMAFS